LPKHKNAILGLITSKFPQIEDKAEMKMNVYTAAELAAKGSRESKEEALQRLGVSPQCGFASHADGKSLGHEDMINKLTLVCKLVDESFTKKESLQTARFPVPAKPCSLLGGLCMYLSNSGPRRNSFIFRKPLKFPLGFNR